MEGQGPWSYRKSELPKLDIAIDRGPRFAAWKIQWESYCALSGLLNQPASTQVQALTLCMSKDTVAFINTLGLSEEDMKDQAKIIDALEYKMIDALESNLDTLPPVQQHVEDSGFKEPCCMGIGLKWMINIIGSLILIILLLVYTA